MTDATTLPMSFEGGFDLEAYRQFLSQKVSVAESRGFACDPSEVHPRLKPHQRDIVAWAVRGGRRAVFAAFGLGKTMMQLEIVRLVLQKAGGGRALIVLPLGVRQEFVRDAAMLDLTARFIRSIEDASTDGIYLTNYETVRDGKLDPRAFTALSLDEAGILRGLGGTKTFREFMRLFEGTATYRFVATATPSPNEFIELLAYSAFLDVMDVGQAKTRFFKRNSEKADALTLHAHKEREFWLWVASWAIFIQKPSDLGYSDEGYELPPLDVRWHQIPTDHARAVPDSNGQARLFANTTFGVVAAAREKRESLSERVAKLLELRAEDPGAHRVIWHDLEDERRALERAIPGIATVYGSQMIDTREPIIRDFADGCIPELACKPVMLGSGVNFQRHCSWAIYLGIGFKFADFIQSIHRLQRFLQPKSVRVDLIYTEAEAEVRAQLERKWQQHTELVANMTAIIREYGLSEASMAGAMSRGFGVERREVSGPGWTLVNNDCVEETQRMATASVDLIHTSIPFSTMYEYSPSRNDFGHTDDEQHFWEQMDFLTPQLLRVLKPGRNLVVHVKDRVEPGGVNKLGFQTVQPFHCDAIYHYRRHGFAYLGMRTIVTDVVRENTQTYRLGWTEQCKDGTRMGVGMPEYLLLFRKPPSDLTNGYADTPVVKAKPQCDDHGTPAPFDSRTNWKRPIPGTGYSRARWQLDAHGFWRLSGDRLLSSEEIASLPHKHIYRLWRDRSREAPYDIEAHVKLVEELDHQQRLPASFMLLPPHSWHPDVWTDVTRMRTLNGAQWNRGKQAHLCPLQFDIVDRVVEQMSMPGELVYDPFSGLGTVPLRAVKLGRRGLGVELSPSYHDDAVLHQRAVEHGVQGPTLFDLLDEDLPEEVG
ncbi:MAG: DNA methyltransferase [Chloroflexota bacterium]